MAVATEHRIIGGRRYDVTQLTALKARALFVRLVKLAGPMAAALLGSGNARGFLDMDTADLGPMVTAFCERLTDEELDYFCETLGDFSTVSGERGEPVTLKRNILDVEFAGRLLDLFKWMAFALEVNFRDFLSAAQRIPAVKSTGRMSERSPSPEASTGTFSAS